MTTREESTQEERIQNLTPPRAEPKAANMTILRRDLLTGGALVLLSSASGCGSQPQKVRTQFMADFTKKYIGDPTTLKDPAPYGNSDTWPDPGRKWPTPKEPLADAVNDYLTFVNVLLTVGFVGGSAPSGPNASLAADIAQFLQTEDWPTKTTFVAGTPSEYNNELPTVHLVEVAVIQDRLLQALNSYDPTGSGKGGGGSNWPPH